VLFARILLPPCGGNPGLVVQIRSSLRDHLQRTKLATISTHPNIHLCVSLNRHASNLEQNVSLMVKIYRPISAYWALPQADSAFCVNEGMATLIGGIVKTLVDLVITTLPIPIILQMNIHKRQKYGVAILLGLGYVVTAAGALRTYFTWKTFFGTNDTTWFEYPAFLASAVENDLAVVPFSQSLFLNRF
jgi:hypothetical protein